MLTILTFAAAAANPALPTPRIYTIRADGIAAEYSRTVKPDGSVELEGYDRANRMNFRLKVGKDGKVRGHYGNVPVEYRVSDAE